MRTELAVLGDVTVVAPSDVRSASGHSISLSPVACQKVDILGQFHGYSVDGTPADCVKLALNELIGSAAAPVDIIVSGINHGANVGIHVYYSGTVAAAIEGAFHGIPAVAVSAVFEEHMDMPAAARYATAVIRRLLPLAGGNVININIPRLSRGEPAGVRVVPHGTTGFVEGYLARHGDNGQTYYTFSDGAPKDAAACEGTDTHLLAQGYVTVSALRLDMNDGNRNDRLRDRLEANGSGA